MITTPERPQQAPRVASFDETAEAFLALLVEHGVDKIFINPGTDTFPIQEAWAKRRELGLPSPDPVMCIHEHIAVSAAHGYYLASGRPQVAIVHVDCGTINAGGAIHNAQRSEAGVVFCAGRAPYTSEGEMPGGKDNLIHWFQEQMDQASIVRTFVKWHYELARSENIASTLERAFQIASNEPAGPVYLTLPREVLMQPAINVRLHDPRRINRVSPPAADPAAIGRAASLLAAAERPLIVAGRNGKDPASMLELVRVAELLGAPVADSGDFSNMPGNHPLNLGAVATRELPKADCVLFLDSEVLYVPNLVQPAPDASIIQIDLDPARERYVVWNFPIDLRITASSTLALRQLWTALNATMTGEQRQRAGERRKRVEDARKKELEAAEARARSKSTQRPLDPEWLVWRLKHLLPPDAIILDESVGNREWNRLHLRSDEPRSRFISGGSSLGWAPGAAIGVKLACPERTVVSLIADGAFNFGSPVAALWSAQKAKAATLSIIFNNACYTASKVPLARLYPNGACVRSGDFIVTDIAPPPDYALLAQSCGAFGVTIRDPEEVDQKLSMALQQVQNGRSAVVDAIIAPS